jgi:LPS sulfotransferase NodH
MSAAHDCPFGTPTHRFLILAEPRSGSTLLVEALRNSGVAGVPFEYLNPRYVERWAARMGIEGEPPMRRYLKFLLRRRTTPNGVFTIKVQPDQLLTFQKAGAFAQNHIRSYKRFVLMRRRDKLAQAVSYYRALASDVWNVHDRKRSPGQEVGAAFDPAAISLMLRNLFQDERTLARTARAARKRNVPVHVIDYEALDADFAGTWQALLEFLELPPVPAQQVRTTLERQRDTVSERLAERYRATLQDSGPWPEREARTRFEEITG